MALPEAALKLSSLGRPPALVSLRGLPLFLEDAPLSEVLEDGGGSLLLTFSDSSAIFRGLPLLRGIAGF